MVPRPFRVERHVRETFNTWTIELSPVAGPPFPFEPGQFAMDYVFGVGEVPISISGNPGEPGPLIQTVRAIGTVTKALCALRPGQVLGIRGPFGSSWPVVEAKGGDILIVAGGIGLPPLRGAINYVIAHRAEYGRVMVLYGSRTPEEIVFRKEIQNWRSRLDVEVDVTVDAATGDWRGRVGVVTTLIPRVGFDPDVTVAFVVGPEIMMRFAARALIEEGLPPERMWLSMERNMECGVGLCGHCQYGPHFVCRDGAVFPYNDIAPYLGVREL
jgi:NAD(P)H-flavin reductase